MYVLSQFLQQFIYICSFYEHVYEQFVCPCLATLFSFCCLWAVCTSYFLFAGVIFCMTSPDDPVTVLPKLRNKSVKDAGMLTGVYKQTGDRVGDGGC